MPAILILGFDLELSRVLLVSVLGGVLGILMMIPLRRALIVKEHGILKYPEGTACAAVLTAGASPERRLAASAPHARVVALSMHKDSVYVREILRAGARGYLLKDSGAADLVAAIRAVASGESYLSPAVSNAVLDDYRHHATNPIDLLTSREREVLQMLAEGKTNKEIAGVLNLSAYTVEAHRGRVMEKLNVHTIADLVRFAVRNGLVD